MFTNNLLKKLSPVDTYVHLGRSRHSQHFFQRLCMILLLSLVGIGAAWAEDVTIKTLDWSASEWSSHSTICATAKEETVNGIKFTRSKTDAGGEYKISGGVLTFTNDGNATNDYRWIAIPLTDVNGKITVNIAAVSGKQLQVKYEFVGGSTTINKPTNLKVSDKTSTNQPLTFSVDNIATSNGVLYLGRNGSGQDLVGTITITTESTNSRIVCEGYNSRETTRHPLATGQTLHMTFHNQGNAGLSEGKQPWYNWILFAGTNVNKNAEYMALRADSYDIHNDGNSTTRLVSGNWEDYIAALDAGANVDLYVSNSGSKLYVHAVTTSGEGTKFTYTAETSTSASTVYIALTGDHCDLSDIDISNTTTNAVTLTVNNYNTTTTSITNSIGMSISSGVAMQPGEKVTISTTANSGYAFKAWNGASSGKAYVGKDAVGDPTYKYVIDALTASATITATAATTPSYTPSTDRHIYSLAMLSSFSDLYVESQKFTGDYDMLNYATIRGGKTTLYNGNATSDDVMLYAPGKTINLNGSGASYVKVELLAGNNMPTLAEGDVIEFTGDGELNIKAEGGENTYTTSGKTYTVKAGDDLIGKNILYFYKNGSAQIKTLTITRPPVMHTITFHSNNGSDLTTTQDVEDGVSTPLAANTFSGNTTAHSFVGWNTAADGTGTDYTAGQSVSLNANLDLYAQWFRFSPQGGQTTSLGAGTNKNYTFVFNASKDLSIATGDFEVTSSDEGKATAEIVTILDKVGPQIKIHGKSAGDVTITMRFKGKGGFYTEKSIPVNITVTAVSTAYTVSFDAGKHGHSASASLREESAGAGIVLPKVTPYAGYTFLGWATTSGATIPDAGLAEAAYSPTADVTLYAVYSTGNTVGNANTGFWQAFSKFIKLDEGKSYSATFTNNGGDTSFKNWLLIATSNNTGHATDGSACGDNEYFVLRADGGHWKGNVSGATDGTSVMYSGEGAGITEFNAIDNAEFIEAMKNATVNFTASRVGDHVYVYVTTTCTNGKKYVEKYTSGTITSPVYLSFTTENSVIKFSSEDASKAAYLVKATANGNGTASVVSAQGADINNFGMAAGSSVTFKAVPNTGYKFTNWTNSSSAVESTSKDYSATVNKTLDLTANFAAGSYKYTVNAVDDKGVILRQLATGTYTTGQTAITVPYPQYILNGTTLYNTPASSGDWYRNTFTPTEDNTVINIQYNGTAVQDVVYYVEGEDITEAKKAAHASRASNGGMGYTTNSSTFVSTTCTLPAGVYQIYMRGVNSNNTTRVAKFTDGTKELASFSFGQNTNYTSNSAIFQLTEQKTIQFACDGASAAGLDWFYVKKYDDVLCVTTNEQRYTLSKDNLTNDAFFTASTTDSKNWPQKTINGHKEYVLDMKSNRSETVRVTGAMSYEIIVMNNGESAVNLTVDGGNKSIPAKSTSSTGLILISNSDDVTTISFTNTSGNTIYPYQIIFYTESPKATLNTDEVTAKVGKTMTFDLSTASGGAITMSPSVTSNEFASAISFDGSKLSVTGIKEGSFDLTFNIGAGGGYAATTGYKLKVNVEKQLLTLKYTPEFYKYNADTGVETNTTSPTLSATIENDKGEQVPFDLVSNHVTVIYASDDETVATVNSSGTIEKVGSGQGSADITAEVNNTTYKSNVAVFTVTIEQGSSVYLPQSKTPTVGEVLTLNDNDGETPLVYATFGGWKWGTNDDKNDHGYVVNGSKKTDSWAATGQYTGTQGAKPNYVDGYSWQSGGKNDACDEYKGASDSEIFGKTRYGWFRPTNDPHISPFSLPVRGTYMTFEPQQNGMLTVYILQNGAFNSTTAADGSSKVIPGEFQPHSFHVVDQSGTPVPSYTDFTFTVKEPVTQKTKNGEDIVCGYDETMKGKDLDNGMLPAGVTYDEKDVATWPMFYENFSKDERIAIKKEWTGGKNGAQGVVKLHDGSFLITQKAYVKYTFYVAASRTYYLFSNFSKMGFAAMNFVPDASTYQPDPSEVLALNDATAFPTLKDAATNKANTGIVAGQKLKLSIPQYGKITVNRNFTAGQWNTICLPFDMTEREVEENFGKGTQLLIYDGVEDGASEQNIHFVYHEIQSILAGYPYLIKTTQDVSGITVKNKLIQPKNTGTPQTPSLIYTQGKDLVTFSADRYYKGTPYVSEPVSAPYTFTGVDNYSNATPMQYKNGSIYMSGTGLKRLDNPAGYSTMKGYRAYLKSNTPTNSAKSLNVYIMDSMDEDVPTGIEEVIGDAEGEQTNANVNVVRVKGIFTLSGQKITGDLRSLPAGVYIVNGKKMYVK